MLPGGPPDMSHLLGQVMDAQARLAEAEVTGTAGGGLVTATVSGTGELKALTIDPKAVDPDDTETLADLVVAAIRAANEQAQQLAADTLGPFAAGLGGLPGVGM